MYRLFMVLGTILATGWLLPAQAGQGDWDIFADKLCQLSMYNPANRPECVKKISNRVGDSRNYLKTVQEVCLQMDINPDTYGYGVFMNRTMDCYEGGLNMIGLKDSFVGSPEKAYADAVRGCGNHGDYGWIIRCYDNLIFKLVGEKHGADAHTDLAPEVRPMDVIDVPTITMTDKDTSMTQPMNYAEVAATVEATLKRYSKRREPNMGATRSWTCEVSATSVEACTVHLNLPYDWCYSGHFVLKFRVDSKTGKSFVTHYDWDAAN